MPASSVVLRRDLALQFPFNEKPEYHALEDYDCWLRILASGRECLKLKAPLMLCRKSAGQISRGKASMARKVYHMHRSFPGCTKARAGALTVTHLLGATFTRFIQRKM